MANNKTIILAIDGGGIRGIIPAYILTRLETRLKSSCYQMFDIIGGTSTGGIIATGLTSLDPATSLPYRAGALFNIYINNGANIFVPQSYTLNGADYYANDGDGNGIEPFLQQTVGASTSLSNAQAAVTALSGARVKQMFTTGYIVSSTGQTVNNPVQGVDYGPYLFNWADAVADPANNDYYLWEAARATSAAPVYFPVASVGGGSGNNSSAPALWVVDGGVMSNDPAMWAFSEAFRLNLAANISDLVIISIGTGVYPGANGMGIHTNYDPLATPDDGNWDSVPWVTDDMYDLEGYETRGAILDVILGAVPLVADAQLNALVKAGLTYYRLEPKIPQSLSAMDNITPANIQALQSAAQTYIAKGGPGYAIFNDVVSALQ